MNVQALDVISVNLWSILISIANLLIIYLIVKKILFKPVTNIMNERRLTISRAYSEADKAKEEAERYKDEYSDKLSNAENEAALIISSAKKKAESSGNEIIEDAREKASLILKKADADIELEKKKAVNDIKNEISGISLDIAERIIDREINEKDHRDMINSFIDEIGE